MSIVRQFLKYSSVAATSALVDWLIYGILIYVGAHYMAAQVVSRLVGGAYAFVANKYWSFQRKDRRHINVEGRRFLILYVFSYSLSLLLLYVLGDIAGLNIFVAKLIADGACLIVNFIVMRGYVFHQRVGIIGRLRAFIQHLRQTA